MSAFNSKAAALRKKSLGRCVRKVGQLNADPKQLIWKGEMQTLAVGMSVCACQGLQSPTMAEGHFQDGQNCHYKQNPLSGSCMLRDNYHPE